MNTPNLLPSSVRVLRRLAALSACVLLFAGKAAAAVPQIITYQGNLRQNGLLVSGSQTMSFNLYASSTAAAPLWSSPSYSVAVATGLFRVALDLSSSGVNWEGSNPWLELVVGGTVMSPREQLTTTPYALDSLMLSGKKYTSASSAPTGPGVGDLWFDTTNVVLNVWNGSAWAAAGGGGGGVSLQGSSPGAAQNGNANITGTLIAGAFSGSGAALTSIPESAVTSLTADLSGKLAKGGDAMSGPLTLSASTLTVTGQDASGYSVKLSSGLNTPAGTVVAGLFVGNGAGLTNVPAANVAAANVTAGNLAPNVYVLSNPTVTVNASLVGNGSSGNGLGVSPSSVAVLNAAGLVLNSQVDSSSVTKQGNLFNGAGQLVRLDGAGKLPAVDGSNLTGVSASNVAAGNVTAGPVASSILPSTVAYTSVSNTFTAAGPQVFSYGVTAGSMTVSGGVTASSGTFTATGAAQYSVLASSGINVAAGGVSAPFFSGAFYGSGAGLTGVAASNVAAANVSAGTFGGGVLLPAASLINGPVASAILPSTVAYTSVNNTFTAAGPQVFSYGIVAGSATLTAGLTVSSGTFTQTGNAQYSLQTSSGVNVQAGGVTAPFFSGAFFGNGAGLTSISATDSTKVAKAGDAMTGPLTMASGSTITVSGNAFSVGGSTLVVAGGNVGIGGANPGTAALELTNPGTPSTAMLRLAASAAPKIDFCIPNLGGCTDAPGGGNTGYLGYVGQRDMYLLNNAAGGSLVLQNNTGPFNFANGGGTSRMYIDGSGNVGIGTTSPATLLDVNGAAQFGAGATKSTFTATGDLNVPGTVTAASFSGSGAGLTGVTATDSTKVLKAGDAMTGQLTLAGSTLTVTGNAFSVGGSTLAVSGGSVGIGVAPTANILEVGGTGNASFSNNGYVTILGLTIGKVGAITTLYSGVGTSVPIARIK